MLVLSDYQLCSHLKLEEIRAATNKVWVLGGEKFKQQTELVTGRRVSPLPQDSDKKIQVISCEKGIKTLAVKCQRLR